MDIRRLARGSVEWGRLERVALTLAARYDRESVRVEFLPADNWLSTPLVVDDEFFVKVVSRQNALVQAILSTGRNVGALSSGVGGFFGRFDTPREMVEHEYTAAARMRDLGVNAPRPIEAFEANGLGILVLEYLPDFRTLDALTDAEVERHAPALLEMLATLHDGGLVHGDVRATNVLCRDGELYFIDATVVDETRSREAAAYDLACALAVLAPRIGSRTAVEVAAETFRPAQLLAAHEFLDFVGLRPDHAFDTIRLRSEVERAATRGG